MLKESHSTMGDEQGLSRIYTLIQSFYWITFLFLLNYQGNFLLAHGFTNTEVGLNFATCGITTVFFQLFLSKLTDRFPNKALGSIISILLVFVLGLVLLLYVLRNFKIAIFIIFVLISAVYSSIQVLVTSVSVRFVNQGYRLDFSQSRGIASFVYAGVSFFLGLVIAALGVMYLPLISLIPMAFLFAVLQQVAKMEGDVTNRQEFEEDDEAETEHDNLLKKYPGLVFFLVGLMLIYLGYNYLYSFLIQIITSVGGDSRHMTYVLSLGAVAETIVMVNYTRLRRSLSASKLLSLALIGFLLKSFILALLTDATLMVVLQVTQAIGYGLYLPAGVDFMNQVMSRKDEVRGQLFLGMSTYSGYVLASLSGGVILDQFGPVTLRWIGFGITALGLAGSLVAIPKLAAIAEKRREKFRQKVARI